MKRKQKQKQKQARMADQSSSMVNLLPSHILMEIISRLPIKSVMTIRCVCKSLLSLVSDSHFQILHSTRAPTELFVSGWTKSSTTLYIAEYVFQDDSLTAVDTKSNVVLELPNFSVPYENCCNFGATKTTVTFVNSCRGLVCYKGPYGNRFAVICNPFTREFITFRCPTRVDKNVRSQGISYGLGFSPKYNRFKLLRLIYRTYVHPDSGEEKSRLVAEIYTFGERGSWKRVANRPYVYVSLIGLNDLIFHEGTLHWYSVGLNAIATFDFDTELFGKLVVSPHTRSSSERPSLDIGVFENCLYTTGFVGDYVDIWALKEYGQDSWIKIFSIQKDVQSFSENYQPFKYLQNGQVLMFKKLGGIVCFNPDTGSVKKVGGMRSPNRSVFIRPSLVSLKVLLGDNVKVHSVKPWDRNKVATIPRAWTSSVVVKDIVKAVKDSQGCVPGSSAPRSSSEASASSSHPTNEKVEDVVTAILESQQGGAEAGSFGSQDPRPPKDRRVGHISSETQKLGDEIETLKAEDERKAKVIETLNAENERKDKVIETLNVENERKNIVIETSKAENDRQGKAIAKLKQRKNKDRAFMRFMYQQMLSSSDDSD